MTTTLSDGNTTVLLDPDLRWADEHAWWPVVQTTSTLLSGSLLVECAARQTGRPITLAGGDDRAWMTGTVLEQLAAWASVAGKTLTLVLRGVSYPVIFRHHDAPALDAQQIIDYSDPLPDDWYAVTLKLMVI